MKKHEKKQKEGTNTLENNSQGISAFTIKTSAIVAMTFNHIAIVYENILPEFAYLFLYSFGGLTFPVMAYFLGEGYRHTKDKNKYLVRIFVFALLTQPVYTRVLGKHYNVLFTLFLGLLSIYLLDQFQNKNVVYGIIVLFIIITRSFDWGTIGIPMILLYYNLEHKIYKIMLPLAMPLVVILLENVISKNTYNALLPNILYIIVGGGVSVILLLFYNGKQGYKSKYFFYLYYPIHILILGAGYYLLEK